MPTQPPSAVTKINCNKIELLYNVYLKQAFRGGII